MYENKLLYSLRKKELIKCTWNQSYVTFPCPLHRSPLFGIGEIPEIAQLQLNIQN
jgi:hypothetical protein